MIGYLIGRGHEKAGHYQLSITALPKKNPYWESLEKLNHSSQLLHACDNR